MHNEKNVAAPNLASMTEAGYQMVLEMVRALINSLKDTVQEGDQALVKAIKELNRVIDRDQNHEVLMALLGEMSSGKTSLVNAALEYPLFPVAKVTTSACPLEIRYGKTFKLQVFKMENDEEKVIFTYDHPAMLSMGIRRALLTYVQNCVKSKVLVCENFDYCFDIRRDKAKLEGVLDDVLQCAQLLIALLNGYIGQEYESISQTRQTLIEERERLFEEIFQIPADTSIGVRIWIDSDILKNGLTLVDLPGLGSDTKTHTDITTKYINKAHCCVMLFGMDGNVADNRSALDLIQDYEIMRFPGKDSRFILAINKCDEVYEKDRYYDEKIEQAAQSIYHTLRNIEIREIIPISAWYAEYRYVRNGIPLENTMLGSLLLRRGETPEAILERMERNYETSFEYTDPRTKQTVSYSTRQFMEETIGEYCVRIRYLNLAKHLYDFVSTYQETLHGLEVETTMIALLEVLGSDLMKELMKCMDSAMKRTQDSFLNKLADIGDEMDASRLELANMLTKEVLPSYESELEKADGDLKAFMRDELKKMQCDFFDHFCIDEKDSRSQANKKIYDGLVDYFTHFEFNSYLKPGNDLLNNYLKCQRKSYDEGVASLSNSFGKLPAYTSQALNLAFDEFMKSERLEKALKADLRGMDIAREILKTYRACYKSAQHAIVSHQARLANDMIQKINSIDYVKNEIDTSITKVFEFFSELIDNYHTKCNDYLLSKQRPTFWSNRPYLEINKIEKEIHIPFYSEGERKGYVVKLNEDMIGQQPESHNSRMERAFKKTMVELTNEASRSMSDIASSISGHVGRLFSSSADEIQQHFFHIRDSIHLIDRSLTALESDECVQKILNAGFDWAMDASETVKNHFAQTHTLVHGVLDKVCQHIAKGEDAAIESNRAVETEQV